MVENNQSETFQISNTTTRYGKDYITLFHCNKILNIHISYQDNPITIEIDGQEHKIVRKREEFIDNPEVFVYDSESPITFSLRWKKIGQYFGSWELTVNGILVEQLPKLAIPNINLQNKLCIDIMMNDKRLHYVGNSFSDALFQDRLDKILGPSFRLRELKIDALRSFVDS